MDVDVATSSSEDEVNIVEVDMKIEDVAADVVVLVDCPPPTLLTFGTAVHLLLLIVVIDPDIFV